MISDRTYTRLLAQIERKISLVSDDLVNRYLDFGKQPLTPQTLCRISDIRSGNSDEITDFKPGIADNYIIFIVVSTLDLNIGYFICLRQTCEMYGWIVNSIRRGLRRNAE